MVSRLDDVDAAEAVERAVGAGVCAVGGRLVEAPDDLAAAVHAVAREWDERVARRLERFAAVPSGARVWTRDGAGLFRCGELVGPWRYDADPDAWRLDVVHVRACRWSDPLDPPGAVLDTFARGGRNFQRVRAL